VVLTFGASWKAIRPPNEEIDDHLMEFTSHVEPRAAEWCAIERGEDVPELDLRIAAGSAIRSGNDVREASDHQGKRTVS
jgi:hypothetical protein